MRTLSRNKRTIYICKKDTSGNIIKYKEPIEKKFNYQPTNTSGDLLVIGENYPMYLRIICSEEEAKYFEPGDRVYVYEKPPVEHDVLCKKADFVVSALPMTSNNQSEIQLERLVKKIGIQNN